MAFGNGMGGPPMMGRTGADIDPTSLYQRQQLANQLYSSALAPPTQPQLSWTQGAARVAQALAAGYEDSGIQKDRDQYKQDRLSDMQTIGGALSNGGDLTSVISQLKNPEAQDTALSFAKDNLHRRNESADKINLQGNQQRFEIQRDKLHNQYVRSDKELDATLHAQTTLDDPAKKVEKDIERYASVVNDDAAPPEIRARAKELLEENQRVLGTMRTPGVSLTVNNAPADTQTQSRGLGARDRLSAINQIMEDAQSGKLTNLNVTPIGMGTQTALARLGLPTEIAATSRYDQNINKGVVDQIRELQSMGGTTPRITKPLIEILKNSQVTEGEPMESAVPKLFMIQQGFERAAQLADLNHQWVTSYKGTDRKNPDGRTFDDVAYDFMASHPIITYEQKLKQDAQKAAAAAQTTNPNPQPVAPQTPTSLASPQPNPGGGY